MENIVLLQCSKSGERERQVVNRLCTYLVFTRLLTLCQKRETIKRDSVGQKKLRQAAAAAAAASLTSRNHFFCQFLTFAVINELIKQIKEKLRNMN